MLMPLNRISQLDPKMISEQVLTLSKGRYLSSTTNRRVRTYKRYLMHCRPLLGWAAETANPHAHCFRPTPPVPTESIPINAGGTGEPGVIRGQ